MAKAETKPERIDALALLRGISGEEIDEQIGELQKQIDVLMDEMRALRTVQRSVLAREGKLSRRTKKPKAAAVEPPPLDPAVKPLRSLEAQIESVLATNGPTSIVAIARRVGVGVITVAKALGGSPAMFEDTGAGVWQLRR